MGLDGVFSYDHLFPMAQPERPSLSAFPLLGAVAQATSKVKLGTLVARIGVLPDQELIGEVKGLEQVAPGRVIAGLGLGDHLSLPESQAYGLPIATVDDRYSSLAWCVEKLKEAGIEVWLGGTSKRMRNMAAGHGVTLNVWLADSEGSRFSVEGVRSLTEEPAEPVELSLAGVLPRDEGKLMEVVGECASQGCVSWVVAGRPIDIRLLAKVAREVRG